MNEIQDNISKVGIEISQEEISDLLEYLDSDKNGSVSKFEFVSNLENLFKEQKNYAELIGNTKGIYSLVSNNQKKLGKFC